VINETDNWLYPLEAAVNGIFRNMLYYPDMRLAQSAFILVFFFISTFASAQNKLSQGDSVIISREIISLEQSLTDVEKSASLLKKRIDNTDTLITAILRKRKEIVSEREGLNRLVIENIAIDKTLDSLIKDQKKLLSDLRKQAKTTQDKEEMNLISKSLTRAGLGKDSLSRDLRILQNKIDKRMKESIYIDQEMSRLTTRQAESKAELDKANSLIEALREQITKLRQLLSN
jgi:chromosome segregation ATPase